MKRRCEGTVDDVDQKSLSTKKTEWRGMLSDEKAHPRDVSHGCFHFFFQLHYVVSNKKMVHKCWKAHQKKKCFTIKLCNTGIVE